MLKMYWSDVIDICVDRCMWTKSMDLLNFDVMDVGIKNVLTNIRQTVSNMLYLIDVFYVKLLFWRQIRVNLMFGCGILDRNMFLVFLFNRCIWCNTSQLEYFSRYIYLADLFDWRMYFDAVNIWNIMEVFDRYNWQRYLIDIFGIIMYLTDVFIW